MKVAITDNCDQIAAGENAPLEARCPFCHHPVLLRKRRLMNNRGFVYYWHHKPGGSLDCPARSSYARHG